MTLALQSSKSEDNSSFLESFYPSPDEGYDSCGSENDNDGENECDNEIDEEDEGEEDEGEEEYDDDDDGNSTDNSNSNSNNNDEEEEENENEEGESEQSENENENDENNDKITELSHVRTDHVRAQKALSVAANTVVAVKLQNQNQNQITPIQQIKLNSKINDTNNAKAPLWPNYPLLLKVLIIISQFFN